ncbi:TauD/TfdA family dioxygenase [Paraneptunicella aestuarii]|uniref:TauD/TfdA family dioxygenase n=1 Tax=Paraneptunicella aestuarii TaxID=2831148 RepID=UPI001E4B9230|nr:TauD/TfdA family dioxygenase [Paraneptunicella aestuarii]UAA37218.1 TauD/TfdA family dioxygenase [Paraneptunicella aestuarii]
MVNNLNGIQVSDLELISGKPMLIHVDPQGEKVTDWAQNNHSDINRLLDQNGALLIRGLRISGSKQLSRVLSEIFSMPLLSYVYRSTPRTQLRANVYTATEYHPDETILQHNESSYSNKWPTKIGFFSQVAASIGGETPIADSHKVFEAIPVEIREKFIAKKVMYVRNYQDIDLPWSEVFQTTDKTKVESYCRDNDIQFEWIGNNGLRTKQINQATLKHPHTNKDVWFNQAHLFHVSSLTKSTKESLVEVLGKENLPRNAYFGDGSEIDEQDLDVIRRVYADNEIVFKWQENDLMILDNLAFSHGRKPFSGERKTLTAMA